MRLFGSLNAVPMYPFEPSNCRAQKLRCEIISNCPVSFGWRLSTLGFEAGCIRRQQCECLGVMPALVHNSSNSIGAVERKMHCRSRAVAIYRAPS
jgi:hypothetical protein